MLFNSWQFLFVFLPIAVGVFHLIPRSSLVARKLWLAAISFVFYGSWKSEYTFLLAGSICFNYTLSECLARCPGGAKPLLSRGLIIVSVSGNVLLLAYFKYTNFLAGFVNHVTGASFAPFEIILPLAISFFTFTQIAYLVDVYRNRSLHYGFLDYTLFVVFFPHLIAGPILRHWEIIPQFRKNVLHGTLEDTAVGLALFTLGMIKKVLLADSVAPHANSVYALAAAGTTLDLLSAWFGTVAFALQIYFDFSGYSDMAIGLARIFGIKFPLNFDSPYKATSIAEFWRRWHMTLSRFLGEYIYFPLGGNRCGSARHSFNILVTMLISGLWHGASMGFVVWGGMHGLMLLVAFHWQKFTKTLQRSQPYKLTAWFLTFVGVVLSWTFFRADSLSTATSVCASMLGIHGVKLAPEANGLDFAEGLKWIIPLLCVVWFAPNSQELLRDYAPSLEAPNSTSHFKLALTPRVGLALGAVLFLLAQSLFSSGPSPFIYFNF